jgi:IS1 family transposase
VIRNDSSTGGFLQPIDPTLANDADLEDLLQPWIVGCSGVRGDLVRPLWQEEPPALPPRLTTWLAFGVKTHAQDWSSTRRHVKAKDGQPAFTSVYRQEELEIVVQCYGPRSDALAANLWNGCQVPQNREYLTLNKMAFTSVDKPTQLAEQVKTKYIRRVDLLIHLRRTVFLRYPVLDIVGAEVEIVTDLGGKSEIVVSE